LATRPVVLIHGYSDRGYSYRIWRDILKAEGYDTREIHTCNYETLTDEISLRDIAEGFDRALAIEGGLDEDEDFDAIVHSTGMLVLRSWLASYASRRSRLKHLIGLAPATFGSPLAHKGRSFLGRIFKGRKELGPDFMEAGDKVLDGLELGSAFTWKLSHIDLLGPHQMYGPESDTPFVFTFCGNHGYGGLRSLVNEPGTDGTVRWAGCALDTRKISLDLSLRHGPDGGDRLNILPAGPRPGADAPLVPVDGVNHGEILRKPPQNLREMLIAALRVASIEGLHQWYARADVKSALALRKKMHRYQQFVVRLIDERNDGVEDYNLELFRRYSDGSAHRVEGFDRDVHVYSGDTSLRCFHVDLEKLQPEKLTNLWLRIITSTGTDMVGYYGYQTHPVSDDSAPPVKRSRGKWDAMIDVSETVTDTGFKFFYPFTTTLIELRIDREPMPLAGRNRVLWFDA